MKRSFVVFLALALFVVTIPLVAGAATISAPHTGSGISCPTCHTSTALGTGYLAGQVVSSPAIYNNVCQSCHRPGDANAAAKPISSVDASLVFGGQGTAAGTTKMQTSHRWDGSDTNPAAGALPPIQAAMTSAVSTGIYDLRGRTGNQLACVRCHSMHVTNTPNGNALRMANDQDQMCMDCHRSRAQQSHLSGSHPVNVNYNSAKVAAPGSFNATPQNANPANPTSDLSAKLTSTGNIVCSTCHGVHYTDSRSSTFDGASSAKGRYNYANLSTGDGYLLRTDRKGAAVASGQTDNLNICTNCHTGKKSHNAKGQNIQCTDCHGAHVDYDPTDPTSKPNVYLIQRNPTTPGASKIYFRYTGSQREYKNANNTGVCQGCHAVPTGAGFPALHSSNNANDCNTCHTHGSPAGSFSVSCDGCHGNPPTTNKIGGPDGLANPATGALGGTVAGNNGGVGAHAAHAINKNMACTTCHNGYEQRAMPTTTIDMGFAVNGTNVPGFKGSSVTGTYNNNRTLLNGYTFTGPIGAGPSTCSTVYCHGGTLSPGDFPNPSWTAAPGSQVYCGSCHSTDANLIPMPMGSHQVHAGDLVMGCTDCHGAIPNDTSHMQGSVQWNLAGISPTAQYTPAVGATAGVAATSGETGMLAPSKNAGGVVTYGTCSNITCHGQGAPTWGATSAQPVNGFPYSSAQCGKCHSGNVAGDVTAATPFYSTAIPKMTANTNAKVGAHTAHLRTTDSVSVNLNCNDCHGTVAAVNSANHMNGVTNFTWSALATKTGTLNSNYDAVSGTCSNVYCHGVSMPGGDTTGLYKTPSWKTPFMSATLTPEACKSCHGFPPLAASGHPVVTSPTSFPTTACTGCHPNVSSTGTTYADIFVTKSEHINGILETPNGGECDSCHGYPPANKSFIKGAGNWANAVAENYTGGGGAHTVAGHVSPNAVKAGGFTNCTPCHKAADHNMGVAIQPSNVKVSIESRVRFSENRAPKYSSNNLDGNLHVPGNCSNVACHFQKTPKW